MTNKIEYNFTLQKSNKGILFQQVSSGLNAVAAVDLSSLNGTMYELEEVSIKAPNRIVKEKTRTISGTTFVSNTPDVLITDMHNEGVAVYYKFIIRRDNFLYISINGERINLIDQTFGYTNHKGPIEYHYESGSDIIYDEFYPVYVNSADKSFDFLIGLDNKKYTHTQSNESFAIYVDSSKAVAKSKDKSLAHLSEYNISNSNSLNFFIDSFNLKKEIFSNNAYHTLMYNNYMLNTEVLMKKNESCEISDDYILLNSGNLYNTDISISVISNGVNVMQIDDVGNIVGYKNIFMRSGKIYCPDLIRLINEHDYDSISVDYSYVKYNSNNISIPYFAIRDMSYISVGIRPSAVISNGVKNNLNGSLEYYIFDSFDNIIYSNSTSPRVEDISIVGYNEINRRMSKAYYNGVIEGDDPGLGISINYSYEDYVDSYSIHPVDYDSLTSMTVGNNNTFGYIEIAKVSKKVIPEDDIILNNRSSIPKIGTVGLRKIRLPSNSIYSIYLTDAIPSILDGGVIESKIPMSTKAKVVKYIENDNGIVIKVDISEDFSNHSSIKFVDNPEALRFSKESPIKSASISDYSVYTRSGDSWSVSQNYTIRDTPDGLFFHISSEDAKNITHVGVSRFGIPPSRYISI